MRWSWSRPQRICKLPNKGKIWVWLCNPSGEGGGGGLVPSPWYSRRTALFLACSAFFLSPNEWFHCSMHAITDFVAIIGISCRRSRPPGAQPDWVWASGPANPDIQEHGFFLLMTIETYTTFALWQLNLEFIPKPSSKKAKKDNIGILLLIQQEINEMRLKVNVLLFQPDRNPYIRMLSFGIKRTCVPKAPKAPLFAGAGSFPRWARPAQGFPLSKFFGDQALGFANRSAPIPFFYAVIRPSEVGILPSLRVKMAFHKDGTASSAELRKPLCSFRLAPTPMEWKGRQLGAASSRSIRERFPVGLLNSGGVSDASSESRSALEAPLSFSTVPPEMVSPVSHWTRQYRSSERLQRKTVGKLGLRLNHIHPPPISSDSAVCDLVCLSALG